MATERWVATTPLGQSIRLSEDGWSRKILVSHAEFGADTRYEAELRETLTNPEVILEGWAGEFLALRHCAIAPKRPKYLCAVYREGLPSGFVITAFFVSRRDKLMKRKMRWNKQP